MHHVSLRIADIHRSLAFYEALGFRVECRFTAGIALACWLRGPHGRLELIQVPQPHPAADAFGDERYTGYYHLSLDVTAEAASLPDWVSGFQQRLAAVDLPDAPLLLPPGQQQIGPHIYEVAFLADPDGLPIELLRWQASLASVDKPD
jgi:catechol 2,3-dioxygenase-like lactoylglutathione lyase family enzyme